MMRAQSGNSSLNGEKTSDGRILRIAVLDSGVYASHDSFDQKVLTIDFMGTRTPTLTESEDSGRDEYGHGTHVAGLLAGKDILNSAFTGIAPKAQIISARVLDGEGRGKTSSLLRALDWLLANHSAQNIRVVNMSLGTAAIDSYRNDPICRAVRRLTDAGVVVVAAAGNNGRDAQGRTALRSHPLARQ